MAYDQDIVALYYPMDVAVDDNYIYLVHDLYPLVVSKYDKASPFTLQATNNTSGLNSGFGRLILDGNYVWVSSANDLMMVKLNKSDLSLVSSSPSANDMGFNGYFDNNSFYRGYHMAFNPAKTELYVADSCNYDYATTRVKVHNPTTLAFIRDYAPVGFPAIIGGVCVDDTHFYVASQDPNYVLDCKIQKYTIDTFTLVATSVFNLDGPNPPGISWLEGLAVDDTYLYCADGYSNRVYRYDKSNLTLVDYVGAADRGTSVFNYPSGVAMPLESPVPPAAITNSIAQVIW